MLCDQEAHCASLKRMLWDLTALVHLLHRGKVILRSVLLIIKLLGPKLQTFLPLILVLLQSSLGR